ncbi:MAG: TonB-dependent receptor [Bacteroidetes bacterium]|nr:TonB-dependent receptor [Bacteroidota bacterium]
MLKFGLIAIGALFIASLASAQNSGTVSGIITTDGEPLPGATISIVNTLIGTTTNASGSYSLSVPAGSHMIRVSFIGFATQEASVSVESDETIDLSFTLVGSISEFGDEIVVLGSRGERTASETPVPVDVIGAQALAQLGVQEINQSLHYLAPSFNASHQTISDGTDHINPASLRGLGPDQVLTLVNGKRRHTSAIVHVNGTFGRGTVGVDLNAIPKSAVKRIEVLRDGASAQYGSDAIAGIINVELQDQTDALLVDVGTGVTSEGDGETFQISGNYGFPIGTSGGFINVTGEFLDRGRTNRSDPFTGDYFPGIQGAADTDAELSQRGLTRQDIQMKTGQSAATMGALFFNSRVPLSTSSHFYANGGVSHRKGEATGFVRRPNQNDRNNLVVYPNGFLPQIHSVIQDHSLTAGVKGTINQWIIDLSATSGGNSFLFNIENSINASIVGSASPRSFDAGTLRFNQTTGNLDALRELSAPGIESLILAIGAEFRVENYAIESGQFESYSLGNGGVRPGIDFALQPNGSPKNSGSQVFPGFQPSNEVNRYRYSMSGYADLEAQVSERFLGTAAIRYENFSDFGSAVNGKLAVLLDLNNAISIRSAISTGFRAPSLHQLWFNNVSTQFVLNPDGDLVPARVLTSENNSAVTQAFGVPNLKQETSLNVSAGIVFRPIEKLVITADFYNISIEDRIVLTSRFSSSNPIVGDILAPFEADGIGAAQFFANAVNTTTRGLDIVSAYTTNLGPGQITWTVAANIGSTEVTDTNIPQEMARIFASGDLGAVRTTLFNREERNRLEDALPRSKGNLGVTYKQGNLTLTTRANYFGGINYKPTNDANDETFGAKSLFDLSVSYDLSSQMNLTVGANNLLSTFPDKHCNGEAGPSNQCANYSSGRFPYSRRVTQFGMNGGFYYAKLRLRL